MSQSKHVFLSFPVTHFQFLPKKNETSNPISSLCDITPESMLNVVFIFFDENSVLPEYSTNKCSILSKRAKKQGIVARKIQSGNTEFSNEEGCVILRQSSTRSNSYWFQELDWRCMTLTQTIFNFLAFNKSFKFWIVNPKMVVIFMILVPYLVSKAFLMCSVVPKFAA